MKKIGMILLTLALVFGLAFTSCAPDDSDTYTVSFDKNTTDQVTGMPSNQTVAKGGKATAPEADPVRSGYTFDGWYDGNAKWNFAVNTVTKNVILKAGWVKSIGGNLGDITASNNAMQKGWATNGTDNKQTGLDIVDLINAEFLELKLEGPLQGGLQIVWQGDSLLKDDGSGDWKWNQTDITDNNGNPVSGKGLTITTEADGTVTLKFELSLALTDYSYLKDAYKAKLFICYYSPDFAALKILEANLIASLNQIDFKFVTFDADGGDFADPDAEDYEFTGEIVKRVVAGSSLGTNFPPNPVKEGFSLEKWVDDQGTEYTSTTVINDDVTLTAMWLEGDPELWTVSFDTDGGSTAPADIEVPDGSAIGTSKFPSAPTKAGNVFAGWFDAADMTTQYNANAPAVTGDITLKAKWTPIVYPSNPDSAVSEAPIAGFTMIREFKPDAGDNLANWAMGKGDIQGDDLTAIKEANPYSVIVISAYKTNPDSEKGWGMGNIGGFDISMGSDNNDETFFVTIKISDLLAHGSNATATQLFVNIWDAVAYKFELWEAPDDYTPPTDLVLYENDALQGVFAGATLNFINGDEQDIEDLGRVDVSGYTKMFIKFKDSFDPNGYVAGGLQGYDKVGGTYPDDWVENLTWGGMDLSGKTASIDVAPVIYLEKIVIKGNNNPQIEDVEKIWFE